MTGLMEVTMKRAVFFSLGVALAALAAGPAIGQSRGGASHFGPRSVAPGISLSAPPTTPLQAQIQQDQATQLQGEQRDLLQQNPSGTTRRELEVGQQLNGFTPH
jgi:hypothetical protein